MANYKEENLNRQVRKKKYTNLLLRNRSKELKTSIGPLQTLKPNYVRIR
jgi:hypothetical protein